MQVNEANLHALFQGYNTSFNKGLGAAPSHYRNLSMITKSSGESETYAWLGNIPRFREWIGDRVVKNLTAYGYAIKNKKFEATVAVERTAIEDDGYGVYGPLMQEMGIAAGEHPDELIFELLASGFSSTSYDGQYFFDTDHPVIQQDGSTASVSNFGGGAGTAWYLMDTSRAIKPLIFQERIPYTLQSLTSEQDSNVFKSDLYLYGVRGRANAGFGLWQLAYASKQTLDATNYAAARAAMMALKSDEGRPLGVKPDTLVVPPSLEQAALQLIQNELIINSGVAVSNEWSGTAKLIVTPWLS